MKSNFLKSLVFLAFTGLSVMGCQDEDSNIESIDNNSIVKNNNLALNEKDPTVLKLVNMGFKVKNIEEYKDFFLVEGDIMFPKNENFSNMTSKTTQAHYNSLVFMENVNNITVRIDNSIPNSGDDNWRTAISNAINDWNNIVDCRVNFVLTTNSTSDILIGSDGGILPNNNPASAMLPSNGNPGFQIAVNLDAANNRVFSEEEKKHIIKHELGHTIGFCHTNATLDERSTSSGYNWIQYTPSGNGTSYDPNSVMNSGSPYSFVFSSYDLFASKYLYPELYSMSEMISYPIEGSEVKGSGGFNITWRPSFILDQNIKIELFLENVLVKSVTEKNQGNVYMGHYGDGEYKIKISSPSNSNSFDIQSFYYVND